MIENGKIEDGFKISILENIDIIDLINVLNNISIEKLYEYINNKEYTNWELERVLNDIKIKLKIKQEVNFKYDLTDVLDLELEKYKKVPNLTN